MAWTLTEDLDSYLAAAGDLLRSRPVVNTIQLSVLATLQTLGRSAHGGNAPLFGWWRSPAGLSYGGLTLWETGDVPVALAGITRTVAGVARVGPVYTQPDQRKRGYGAAVTVAVSQACWTQAPSRWSCSLPTTGRPGPGRRPPAVRSWPSDPRHRGGGGVRGGAAVHGRPIRPLCPVGRWVCADLYRI